MSGPSSSARPLEPRALADRIAAIAADVKAADIRVLDLREVLGYTDYFVVCSGNTERQTKAIYDRIYKELKDDCGLLPRREEIAETVRSICGDDRAVFLDMPRIDVSSTLIRERAAAGLPIRYLVPGRVVEYVESNGLYGASAPAPAT